MRSSLKERIEHHDCPEDVAEQLRLAGGENRFGEPNFRAIWGWNRIVPFTGEWQKWGKYRATLTDKVTGFSGSRDFMKLEHSVIETRFLPKYLPANCWHLEMWRPSEEYGTPESWLLAGEEVLSGMTIDTAGEFPSRGEYELCYPLTDDGTVRGEPLPLISDVVSEIVRMIIAGRERFGYAQRRAAVEQRLKKQEEGFVKRTQAILKDGMRPFAGETFVTKPN